jgi:serine phosphatase RsbU (regulator of sigma subunit)/tetratricopeptide (TPR) repeat protein
MNVLRIVICQITIIFLYLFINLYFNPLYAQSEKGFVSGAAMSNPNTVQASFTELVDIAYQNLSIKNYDKAYIHFKIALKDPNTNKYRDSDDVNWQAINNDFGVVCDTLGTRLINANKYTEAVRYFVEATMPYLRADNQDAVFDITKKMAQISLTNPAGDRFDNAIKKYQDFLTFRKITNKELIAQAHYEIAVLYAEKGEKDIAIFFIQESIGKYDKRGEKIALYKKLASFYKFLREHKDHSILIYEDASNYFKEEIEKVIDHELKANLYLIKADFELKRGRSGSFFKDYTSAINLFQEDNNSLGAAQTCIKAAQMLYEAAEYSKAKAYLEEGKKIISSVGNKNHPDVKTTINQLKEMLDDVQRREKLETIEGKAVTLDEQLEEQQRQFLTIISLVLMSALVFVGISFYNARKSNKLLHKKNTEINQQKEQISEQHENIVKQKNELETSYRNISLLSEIGQKITATLDMNSVVHLVHECFASLVSTDAFAVGVYNNTLERINFIYQSNENGVELPERSVSLQKEQEASVVKCIKTGKEILLNDVNGQMKSKLFLPLTANNKITGVIAVQSTKENAYSKRDMNLLKALASYTSVALANANAYHIIENKNKHITDSLRYGKTIQQALLPSKEKLESVFKESFIFFRPKDIVSGDFYWFSSVYNKHIIAAIDCTGHGVPGAFMSMIGHTLLNEIVNQNKITDPAQVLGLLHSNIRKALNQSAEDGSANDDGMDATICVVESISDEQSKVTFSGAKRPLIYIPYPYTEVKHIRGDRKSIGGLQKEDLRIFNNHEVTLNKKSLIYLFSDGYPDQNGVDKGSMGTKRFEQLLLNHAGESMNAQKESLKWELALHQQDAEQRDDMTIIGIRI